MKSQYEHLDGSRIRTINEYFATHTDKKQLQQKILTFADMCYRPDLDEKSGGWQASNDILHNYLVANKDVQDFLIKLYKTMKPNEFNNVFGNVKPVIGEHITAYIDGVMQNQVQMQALTQQFENLEINTDMKAITLLEKLGLKRIDTYIKAANSLIDHGITKQSNEFIHFLNNNDEMFNKHTLSFDKIFSGMDNSGYTALDNNGAMLLGGIIAEI
jgi:hypothetical protein